MGEAEFCEGRIDIICNAVDLTTSGERGGTLHPLQRTKSQKIFFPKKISILGAAFILFLITEGMSRGADRLST